MNDTRSVFVPTLTGKPRGKALPTHAGWYTGRSVDYLAKVNGREFVHIEVQTRVDRTMKWRMANYFTLLHHRIHAWKEDDVEIHQYLVYLGSEESSMRSNHPKFGSPYGFKVVDLIKASSVGLERSTYYGDRIISLLLKGKSDDKHWGDTFDHVCDLRVEADRMEALFYLLQLADLRGKTALIQQMLVDKGLYDALLDTPLTARATESALIGSHIQMLDEFYLEKGEAALTDEERGMLLDLPEHNVRAIIKAITWRSEPRSIIVAGAVMFNATLDNESEGFGP